MSVFVTLLTGLVITINAGGGGSIDNPVPRHIDSGGVVRLASFDLPNGAGIGLINPSLSFHEDPAGVFPFKKIETTPNVIPYQGAVMGPTHLQFIPDDGSHYRSSAANPWASHVLLGGEIIVIYRNDAPLSLPSAARITQVKNLLTEITNLAEIQTHPRLNHFLKELSDIGAAPNAPQGQDWDMGWTLRNWTLTAGGPSRKGWYKEVCPRGSGGLDNWHYNRLLYLALNFLNNPTASNWEFGLRQAIAHATLGREWTGIRKGMSKYEKGDAFIGEQQPGEWAKQWSAGLMIWALLSEEHTLQRAVDRTFQMHLNVNPVLVWQGHWGARIAARYLEELLLFYLVTHDPLLLAKAQAMITHVESLLGPSNWWPNLGNNGAAEESPWMQVQLVAAIYRWYEQVPSLESLTGFTRTELAAVGAAIMQDGSEIVHGKRLLRYRMGTTQVPPSNIHLTALALPMLRYMAGDDPQFQTMHDEVKSLVTTWGGAHIADLQTGSIPVLSSIGYRYPPQGFGWSKAMLFYLEAMR